MYVGNASSFSDGTTNFVHRIPQIAICVGLAVKKQLRAGIVYNPITYELFTAQAGKGAFKNGFPIHVSKTEGTLCFFFFCQHTRTDCAATLTGILRP